MIKITVEGTVAHLVIDMPGRSMNVLTPAFAEALDDALTQVLAAPQIEGIVLSSGKSSFLAGADLAQMSDFARPDVDTAAALEMIARYGRVFRRIETCGKPVVAAASGTALGGGLELMLCCHYRIAADDPKAKFGTPEVTLGLLPGIGGTQRLPRMLGIAASVPILTLGSPLGVQGALKLGILNEVVAPEELRAAAVRAIREGRATAVAPWDRKGFQLPGGDSYSAANQNALVAANATLHAAGKGNYPAPLAILRAIYEGTKLPIDKALRLEQQLFVTLVRGEVAQNMIRTVFFARQAADKLTRRPANIARSKVQRLGIVGAGFMGAGIAQVAAAVGIEVTLLDRDLPSAQRGRDNVGSALAALVEKGRMSSQERDAVMARIHVTADASGLRHSELVIEAVLEDFATKDVVTRQVEAALSPTSVFASNTSALPIDELAAASVRPDHFIGMHFFSPVSRMALVELIVGKATSQATLARAMDFVAQIRKTPVVVRDGVGFYTTRCVEAYMREGLRLLSEGVNPVVVENAGMALGMPVGPLALADETGIDVLHHVMEFFRSRERGSWADDKHSQVDRIISEPFRAGRFGRKSGAGFYVYPAGQAKHLDVKVELAASQPDIASIKERLLYAQVVEAARCWSDGVIDDAGEADLGAHLAWAFPTWLGGPFAFIDNLGETAFVQRCDELARRHGARFEAPLKMREAPSATSRFLRPVATL